MIPQECFCHSCGLLLGKKDHEIQAGDEQRRATQRSDEVDSFADIVTLVLDVDATGTADDSSFHDAFSSISKKL